MPSLNGKYSVSEYHHHGARDRSALPFRSSQGFLVMPLPAPARYPINVLTLVTHERPVVAEDASLP
jgi:hypothetical protein